MKRLYYAVIVLWAFVIGLVLGRQVCIATYQPTEPAPAVEPVAAVEVVEETWPPYTDEELELLALVIYSEAGGDTCSDDTRQMVGEVVLNRVADPRYPDTLAEVLTQRAQYGRFYWTGAVWPERAKLPQETHAVERAYTCAAALLGGTADRLLPDNVVYQSEYIQGHAIVAEADGFYFCR